METNTYDYIMGKSIKCDWCSEYKTILEDMSCTCGSCLDYQVFICFECKDKQEKKVFHFEF